MDIKIISKTGPAILECTLRDGSYAIDFQFTQSDTKRIAAALDKAGFPYIEIGHGIGLGATRLGRHIAAASDQEYMMAGSAAVRSGKWGMFCIPGIASLDDLRMAADYGIKFVRIGTNVTDIDSSALFIEFARKLGMEVYANFMKSYVLEPDEFVKLARRSTSFGAELVYLVDSAGGMLPNEIRSYLQAMRVHAPEIRLGFHGHNNLGLAVANTLVCAEEGVEVVDTSLQGFGRSAGNTPTEQFLSALVRAGCNPTVDPVKAMHLGETLIRPLIERRGISSLDVVAGQALFHSSYMPAVLSTAKRHRIDPRMLIIELCRINKIEAPEVLLEEIASEIAAQQGHAALQMWSTYFGEEQSRH